MKVLVATEKPFAAAAVNGDDAPPRRVSLARVRQYCWDRCFPDNLKYSDDGNENEGVTALSPTILVASYSSVSGLYST